jgi:hypothetical protein
MNLFMPGDGIREKLNNLDINNLTPIQALEFLAGLKAEISRNRK